jgi:ketosteroid isomerase-like protein
VAPKGDKFPGAGTHHGQSAVREQFVDAVERSYASFGFEPQRYLESEGENFVVAFGSFSGEGLKGTGRLEAPGVQLWEFDGDKVTRVEIFADTAAFPGVLSEDERAEHDKQAEEDEGEERESGAEGEKGEATAEGKASGEREDKESDH